VTTISNRRLLGPHITTPDERLPTRTEPAFCVEPEHGVLPHLWSCRQRRCARGSLVEYSISGWTPLGGVTIDAATGGRPHELGARR
jgi:hypothetical protein